MKAAYLFTGLLLFLVSCAQTSVNDHEDSNVQDSVQLAIQSKVNSIIDLKDSLVMIPSLRFVKGVDETYTAKMYGMNQVTQWVREEQISNESILGRDYYYSDGQLIFIKEEGSKFSDAKEEYTERLLYFNNNEVYKAFEKHQFTEDNMFSDTLFEKIELDLSTYDLEKPFRALQQKGEFTMYFDEFYIIEPQSYLIIENKDKSINAALYIIEGDSLLNVLFENPVENEGKKIWVYHSFREMNGVERMIYEGAVLLEDN